MRCSIKNCDGDRSYLNTYSKHFEAWIEFCRCFSMRYRLDGHEDPSGIVLELKGESDSHEWLEFQCNWSAQWEIFQGLTVDIEDPKLVYRKFECDEDGWIRVYRDQYFDVKLYDEMIDNWKFHAGL